MIRRRLSSNSVRIIEILAFLHSRRIADKKSEQGFISFYKSLEEVPLLSICFSIFVLTVVVRSDPTKFDSLIERLVVCCTSVCSDSVQGYYSVHGRDAMTIASNYFKTTAAVKQLGSGSLTLPSVCVSQTLFSNIVRDLLFSRRCKVPLFSLLPDFIC